MSKVYEKYLNENNDSAIMSRLSYEFKDYKRKLYDNRTANATVLANELGMLIYSALGNTLTQKELNLIKKVLGKGKPLLNY